jgi:hypothetical protein
MPSLGAPWDLPALPALPQPNIAQMLFFSIEETGFQGVHRETTGWAWRSYRSKQNHHFSTELREENYVFADCLRFDSQFGRQFLARNAVDSYVAFYVSVDRGEYLDVSIVGGMLLNPEPISTSVLDSNAVHS